MNGDRLKKNQLILGLVVLAAVAALAVWGRNRIHFDFHVFGSQLAQADWRRIALGVGFIYLAYAFRSLRWALLIRTQKKVGPLSLLGTQVMGFTAVALIGRVADPVRPYLVAKKTGLALSSQVAVYIVERLFDAGSMALIFSIAMLWIPDAEILKATGHSGPMSGLIAHFPTIAPFIARYGGLVLTLLGALFLVAVRISSGLVATFLEDAFGLVSKRLGHAVGHKIRTFRAGLDTMRSFSDFGLVTLLSVAMWALISSAYLETTRAFVASPQLAGMSVSNCVLLMVISGGASIIQLPVLGWFTQIGLVAASISAFYGAAAEASTACAATLLLVCFLAIIPVGLIWAQFEHVSLRKVTHESEHVGEALDVEAPADASDLP
jgi:hypothetical protein